MKNSKILSLILALAMVLAIALPMTVSAASDASITVNGPSSLVLTASDFAAYKLFDVKVSNTSTGKTYAYTPVAGLDGFLTAYPAYGADADAFKAALDANSIDMFDLTKDLKAHFTTGGIAATQISDTSVRFNNLDYGYYLVVGKGENDGVDVIAHCSLVTVDGIDKCATINLKADAPFITKEVLNHNLDNGNGDWDEWTDINIGTNAEFKLTSRVPVMSVSDGDFPYTGYKSYTFTVHDTMSAGLTFNNDVNVYIGGSATPLDASYYSVNIVSSGDGDPTVFDIVFDPDLFVTLTENASIEITYSAELNEYAVIGAPGNPNTVSLEYSNNPYTTSEGDGGDTGETPESVVIVYTFDLDIYKYTGTLYGDDQESLPGAEFELRDSEGNVMSFVELADGIYRLATSADDAQDITTVLISNDEGIIHIDGLDAGEYELEETEAPAGYNLIPGFITAITITHDDQEGAYTVWVDDAETNTVNIQNNKGNELPGTGGMGTTIFYIVSAILTAGLVIFFVSRRKRNLLNAK